MNIRDQSFESKDYGIAIGTITKFLSLPFMIQYKIASFIGSPFNINLDDTDMIMEMFDYVAENGLIEKLREEINRQFNDYKRNAEMMAGEK